MKNPKQKSREAVVLIDLGIGRRVHTALLDSLATS